VLLVNGDPRTVRHEDELFYLETALRPGDRADSALAVTTTTVDELARRRLDDYDVIFLCNVKPPERRVVADLVAWVERGGGLAVTLGDNVDPDAYRREMGPLLARPLRSMRQLSDGGRATVGEGSARLERIGRFDAGHPIFGIFSARAAGLREASFWKLFLVELEGGSAEPRTLAHFTSGAPALIEASLGEGRLLLWASTIDRDWNDLPIHPAYLPLVQQMARHLARSPVEERESQTIVGRERVIPFAEGDHRVEVLAPSGRRTTFEGARLRGRTEVTFTDVTEPGFYEVSLAGAPDAVRPAAAFVANLDPRGSDTTRVADAELHAGGTGASGLASGARRRVELWHALAAALLLFLFSEALLTWRG